MAAGVPIAVHVVCPDGADTDMTRERAHEPESAIIWTSPRMLSAEEVASATVGLLDSKRMVLALPRWRGVAARAAAVRRPSGPAHVRVPPQTRRAQARSRLGFQHDRHSRSSRTEDRRRESGDRQIVASVDVVAPERIGELVERARAAQPGWEALGFEARAQVLKRCQKWVIDNSDRIIETIVSETGKAWEDAQVAEVGYAASAFGFWAKNAEKYLADERVKTASPFVKGRKLILRHVPVGVVGVIGPWNYPLTNSFGDCIPAIAAGNSVILKPSEVTPLTALLMGECVRECGLPDGVYQVAPGFGETGAALIDAVDFLMFTGSTATGKKVMERAARTLTPVALELGGKDPMLVCADADLERAANAAVHYSMQNAGQTCISTERVYVEAPVYDEFVSLVTKKVGELRQGAPRGPAAWTSAR